MSVTSDKLMPGDRREALPDLRVALITHATVLSGLGHLARCCQLHAALQRHGVVSELFVADSTTARQYLRGAGKVAYFSEPGLPDLVAGYDLCVVDLYCYDGDYYRALKSSCQSIVVFDDERFLLPSPVDAVINPSACAADYDGKLVCFSGTGFLMIRDEAFQQYRGGPWQKAFVCCGGSDPERQTLRWVQAVLRATDLDVDVVLGPGFEWSRDREWLENESRVRCHVNPESLAQVAAGSLVAIVGSGTLLYEMAALGIASIGVVLAGNQRPVATGCDKAGFAVNLGDVTGLQDETLENSIQKLVNDPGLRQNMANKGRAMVTPGGAGRLACALVDWAQGVR